MFWTKNTGITYTYFCSFAIMNKKEAIPYVFLQRRKWNCALLQFRISAVNFSQAWLNIPSGFSIFLIFFMQGCQLSCQNKIYGCIFEFFMGILRTKIPFINWLWISLFNCCRRTGYLVIVTTLVSHYFLFALNFYFDFLSPQFWYLFLFT